MLKKSKFIKTYRIIILSFTILVNAYALFECNKTVIERDNNKKNNEKQEETSTKEISYNPNKESTKKKDLNSFEKLSKSEQLKELYVDVYFNNHVVRYKIKFKLDDYLKLDNIEYDEIKRQAV